jgi:hypothetical protein
MTQIDEPPRKTPVIGDYDVIVLGGGPSGIAAALAAAEEGASVALIEHYGFLGGMATAGGVTNFCGLHANIGGDFKLVVAGIATRIIAQMQAYDAMNAPHTVLGKTLAWSYDAAVYRCVLDELLVTAGVDLHFHAKAAGCLVDNGVIDAVFIETKSGRAALKGRVFIDASGDADLAKWSGAEVVNGIDDGFLAYPTLMFRLGNVDGAKALTEGKPNLKQLTAHARAERGTDFARIVGYINPQRDAREWRVNATQLSRAGAPVDATNHDHLRAAEVEGRRQALEYFQFLKRDVPGFEAAYMLDIAPQIGVRETRRIVGEHVLSGEDVLRCREFEDSIGVNGWPVETHSKGTVEWQWLDARGYHQIPYRVLLPKRVHNLLVTGRCASTTQEGQASLRVSGPCFQMGEAAGVAAVLALALPTPRPHAVDIKQLQSCLLNRGAFLG